MVEEIDEKPVVNLQHDDFESDSGHATESDEEKNGLNDAKIQGKEPYTRQIVWPNIGKFIILHSLALYGLTFLPSLTWQSWIFLLVTYQFSGAGITAGAHRLWSHKTYKAKYPLRLFLAVGNSMAGENSIYIWTRDHRTHHKCSETVGDPHNANRGFFFAHMGWLLVRKHPEVIRAGKTINMTDLENDPIVMLQHRHYIPCFLMCGFILPTLIPHLFWGEPLTTAYFMAVVRYVAVLHFTWLVNSAAHFYGMKPYDHTIGPTENMAVSVLAMGEGFHNYHHTFPYDYSTSEWGFSFNVTTVLIEAMAAIGQAYDLRKASPETVKARVARTGVPELTKELAMEIKKVQ
uniref:Acyl-CoA desaturase delta9 n=1 Tax=Calanus hyperboreus TaxID=114069 RepID=W8P2G2_CALHY|nr:acyl-CoA desaturase delta9 [Calanus hyperboreus]